MSQAQTIAWLQTPPGKGGIAVISLAGPDAERIVGQVFRSGSRGVPSPGKLALGHVVDCDRVIDEAIVTHTGNSFEINIHGGPAAAAATLHRLADCGASVESETLCEAFQSEHPKWSNPAIGREMLDALGAARSTLAVSAITNQWSSGLSELVCSNPTVAQLRKAACGLARMQRLGRPAEIVLAGEPNVGKSTLANTLIARQVSIVHDTAGTTRDWVREIASLRGVPIWLTDTAGLWDAPHHIDIEAVRRARQRIAEADLVVLMSAGDESTPPDWIPRDKLLKVAAKCDIAPPSPNADLGISSTTGQGLSELIDAILRRIDMADFDPTAPMAFTQRQSDLLNAAADAIEAGDVQGVSDTLRQLLAG